MRLARSLTALAFAATLSAVPALGHAAPFCIGDAWKQLGVQFGHQRLHEDIEDQWSRCEVLPGTPNRALVLLAYPGAGMVMPKTPGDMLTSYDVQVLYVDTRTNKVLSRDAQTRPAQPDGSGLSGLEFDPQKRLLAKGVRSIGVRLQHARPSQQKFNSVETLSVYAIEGDKLRRVLDRYPAWTVVGEWDEKCAGAFVETRKAIKAAPVRGSGFADLSVRITEDRRSMAPKGDTCVETKQKPTHRTEVLRYGTDAYAVTGAPAAPAAR